MRLREHLKSQMAEWGVADDTNVTVHLSLKAAAWPDKKVSTSDIVFKDAVCLLDRHGRNKDDFGNLRSATLTFGTTVVRFVPEGRDRMQVTVANKPATPASTSAPPRRDGAPVYTVSATTPNRARRGCYDGTPTSRRR